MPRKALTYVINVEHVSHPVCFKYLDSRSRYIAQQTYF